MNFKGKFDPPLQVLPHSTAHVAIDGDAYTAKIVSDVTGEEIGMLSGEVIYEEPRLN